MAVIDPIDCHVVCLVCDVKEVEGAGSPRERSVLSYSPPQEFLHSGTREQ